MFAILMRPYFLAILFTEGSETSSYYDFVIQSVANISHRIWNVEEHSKFLDFLEFLCDVIGFLWNPPRKCVVMLGSINSLAC